MSNILIIGSTGKLGSKLLNFCYKFNINIHSITCNKNKNKLFKQKKINNVKFSFCLNEVEDLLNFYKYIKSFNISLVYFLDVGSESLKILNTILKFQKGTIIAVANKEMIIAGGTLLINKIKKSKNIFLPLDSEHFSLINSNLRIQDIKKVYITASGGPFFYKKNINLDKVKKKQVLSHPKWQMGFNNLIDSSNFVNKILEMYELSSIYDIPLDKVDFIISKEAFVHSIVIYKNGPVTLNGFTNDMLITLIKPLSYIYDINHNFTSKNLFDINSFNFDNHVDKRFIIFNYLTRLKKLPHSEQIHFMVLNNKAQKLYLAGHLKYSEILKFIFKRINFNTKGIKLKSFNEVINYIYSLKDKYDLQR